MSSSSSSGGGNFLLRRLKYLDAYPKTLEDFRVKTFSGATISIACVLTIITLFIYEWQLYTSLEVHQELFVDISRGQKFHINIDITFPHLPCKILSIDSMDISGETQIDVIKGVKRRHLNRDGHDITDEIEKVKRDVGEVTTTKSTTTLPPGSCASCYGAETPTRKCCNTCEEVRQAYRERNWQFSPIGVEQCKDVLDSMLQNSHGHAVTMNDDELNKLLESGEGCRLVGHLEVNRVAGNFHIAPGSSHQHDHAHIHDIKLSQISKFNSTHKIKRFYFGEDTYPNQINPLEKTEQLAIDPAGVAYHYFVKIVPTTYEYSNGDLLNNTYQYSVTKYQKTVSQSTDASRSLPGFFVTYELSPIMVKFIEQQSSLTHFLTSCCAIIGGLFTVAGLLDAFVYRYYNLYKKAQLNKLT